MNVKLEIQKAINEVLLRFLSENDSNGRIRVKHLKIEGEPETIQYDIMDGVVGASVELK